MHPLTQFMLELWHPLSPGNRVYPCQLVELHVTFWALGRPGRTELWTRSPTLQHSKVNWPVSNSWAMPAQTHCFFSCSWKNNSPRPDIWRWEGRHKEWVIMDLAGLGACPCLLSRSTHAPWQALLQLEPIASLKCHRKKSGKEKPKAEEFHEEKAVSFLCSAYRKISESTLSFPKRYLHG